jgi:hypothetical protein
LERSLKLVSEDRVGVARLVAAGVADGLLALGVGPAGAVGDQLAVVAGEQSADDLPDRAQLGVAGLDQSGAYVVPEPEIAPNCFGVTGTRLGAALFVLGGGVAQLVSSSRAPAKYASSRAVGVPSSWTGSRTRSIMKAGSTTQMPAAKSGPRSCTKA